MCVFVLKLWSSLEKSKWPCHAEIFRICKLDEYLVDFLFLVFLSSLLGSIQIAKNNKKLPVPEPLISFL